MHRKTQLIALLLVGICSPAAAQVFNLRHDLEGSVNNSGTAWAVEVTEDGNYLVVCNGNFVSGTLSLGSVVRALVIDATGFVLSEERVTDTLRSTYPGWSNSTAKRTNSGFVTGGSNFRVDSSGNWVQRPVLFLFNSEGQAEEHFILGPENEEWIGRQAKQTPDGGYVICGETSSVGNALQAFVIKTDAQGNEEWTRTYGGPWNDYCKSIEPRTTGGYFLGGQYRITQSDRQMWLAALNDSGEVVWSNTWGGPFEDLSVHAVELADGHVLVAGGVGYGSSGPYRRYLAKLDSLDGSVIWEREYGDMQIDCLFRVAQEIEPYGDLVAIGQGRIGSDNCGTILRTTSAGDSLWMRNYLYHDPIVSGGRGAFRDGIPTPDGGFVAVGTALSVPGVYTQDVWVVKVDSMGCLEPGCHLITGMETQITNLGGALKVWPNPVVAGTPVQVEVQLPEGFVVRGALRLTVTDAAGRVVLEELVGAGLSSFSFPFSSFHTGLYHLHLHDNTRWIAGAKLVVQ